MSVLIKGMDMLKDGTYTSNIHVKDGKAILDNPIGLGYFELVEVIPCEECIHAKQHSYAPAECQYYCTLSLQYHGGRFFCACGERGTDLLEWLHRGDDDE